MPRPVHRGRVERAALAGVVVACALSVVLVAAAGCGGSSGSAVLRGTDAGSDASPTEDASVTDGSPVVDGKVGTDASPVLDASDGAVPAAKRVFLTYHVYSISAFGGLSGADALCQTAADTAALAGLFRAWLSTDGESAASRLTHGTGPYVTLAKAVVASSWAELTSGVLRHAIDRTEIGIVPQTGTACGLGAVWTGTQANGSADPGGNCGNWTDTSFTATLGSSIATTNTWTDACSGVCAGTASLYCIEQ